MLIHTLNSLLPIFTPKEYNQQMIDQHYVAFQVIGMMTDLGAKSSVSCSVIKGMRQSMEIVVYVSRAFLYIVTDFYSITVCIISGSLRFNISSDSWLVLINISYHTWAHFIQFSSGYE